MLNVVFYNDFTNRGKSDEVYLETLINGGGILSDNFSLKSFSKSLPLLTSGESLFSWCQNLISFDAPVESLINGSYMFDQCVALKNFNSNLLSLTNANCMFYGCRSLEKFVLELPRLSNGDNMFSGCTSLTSFTSALPSLTKGNNMFHRCKLDPRSLMYIVETLPTHETNGNITIGLGADNEEQMEEFAKAASFDSWDELKQLFTDKNWTATFQYNGAPATAATLNETGQTTGTSAIYARLLEADEDSGQYISEKDGKFYDLEWGHSVTNAENYTFFGSLLEACGYFGIIPKEFAEQ